MIWYWSPNRSCSRRRVSSARATVGTTITSLCKVPRPSSESTIALFPMLVGALSTTFWPALSKSNMRNCIEWKTKLSENGVRYRSSTLRSSGVRSANSFFKYGNRPDFLTMFFRMVVWPENRSRASRARTIKSRPLSCETGLDNSLLIADRYLKDEKSSSCRLRLACS